MILIIFGIYALIAAKLQIPRHYGLKGKGARIAGVGLHSIWSRLLHIDQRNGTIDDFTDYRRRKTVHSRI